MSVTIEDNADEIGALLDQLVDSFDFTTTGEEESLGQDMAVAVANGIIDRTVAEKKASDGSELRENERKYAKFKERWYDVIPQQPGVRTGQMLSLLSVLGTVTVTTDEVTLEYGLGEPPERALIGGWKRPWLEKQDKKVTDTQKAEWFTDGGRPFYQIDTTISDDVRQVAAEALTKHVQENW